MKTETWLRTAAHATAAVRKSASEDQFLIAPTTKHLLMEEKSASDTVNTLIYFYKGAEVSSFDKREPLISGGEDICIASHFQAERGRAARQALWRETAASCKWESLCEKLLCPLLSSSSSPRSAGMQMSPLIPRE